MSQHRVRPDAGFCAPHLLAKGPRGYALCRYCGKECEPPRKTFCSNSCIHEWKIRTQPGYARKQVFARDRGRCAECGETRTKKRVNCFGVEMPDDVPEWQMDHTVPVVEGGGECGLEGLRTLCVPCHKRATKELAARRAAARRAKLPA